MAKIRREMGTEAPAIPDLREIRVVPEGHRL
jgi:hypothetical protein